MTDSIPYILIAIVGVLGIAELAYGIWTERHGR